MSIVPFMLLRLNIKMAGCKKGNRRNQDRINLTKIILEGENENKFNSNLINGVYLEK